MYSISSQDVEVFYSPQRYIYYDSLSPSVIYFSCALLVLYISLQKKYCEFNTKSPTPPQQLSWFVFLNQPNIQLCVIFIATGS